MFRLFEIGFTLGECVRYLSAGRAGVVKRGSGGPRIRFKYNSMEIEEMIIDLSLFWSDYNIFELSKLKYKIKNVVYILVKSLFL